MVGKLLVDLIGSDNADGILLLAVEDLPEDGGRLEGKVLRVLAARQDIAQLKREVDYRTLDS